MNPTGEALDIAAYAAKAHARGAWLLVDGTLGPPGLQEPLGLGADVVVHSGTKYLGGHSDLLCGVLATRREGWVAGLAVERTVMGSVMGGVEGWLGVRSLRTLELRVKRQSGNAGFLVRWVDGALRGVVGDLRGEGEGKGDGEVVRVTADDVRLVRRTVARVQHASLQLQQQQQRERGKGKEEEDMGWLKKQMPGGFGPVFALTMRTEAFARRLPGGLELFAHATSLGGVESLVEWRAMSDERVDGRVVRVSVGVEGWGDLRDDLGRGLRALIAGEEGGEEEAEGQRERESREGGQGGDGKVRGEAGEGVERGEIEGRVV